MSLYRDYSLILIREPNGPKMVRFRKKILNILKMIGFKIEIKTNTRIINFLDVTHNLDIETYEP